MTDALDLLVANPLAALIAAAEIGFWVFVAAGLLVRYVLRRPRLGAALLICSPLMDLVLLVASAADLLGGATATDVHALAAAYIGGSVAWGHRMVRWADQRVAHRFAGGPPPARPPRYGAAKVRYEWVEWSRCLLFWAISCGLMLAITALVGDPARTGVLQDWTGRLTVVLVIWLVAWPVWTTVAPPRAPADTIPDTMPDIGSEGERSSDRARVPHRLGHPG